MKQWTGEVDCLGGYEVSYFVATSVASRRDKSPTYRACCSSCCLRLRKFMCIIRHVKFSIRSWFGSICFVLLKKRQTWAASGSCFCNSSGVWSVLLSKMPFWKGGNTADRISSWFREELAVRSSLSSWRSARKSPALDGDKLLFSAFTGPARGSTGLRGKRKSCSVDVGFMEDAGLRLAVDDVMLASIVSGTETMPGRVEVVERLERLE